MSDSELELKPEWKNIQALWDFVGAVGKFPGETEHGGVAIMLLPGYPGWEKMMLVLVVDESTTIEAIRESWAEIVEWRRKLFEFQGTSSSHAKAQIAELLWQSHEQGMSYKTLADHANEHFANRITEFVAAASKHLQPGLREWVAEEMVSWGLAEEDGLQLILDAVENARAGREPFLPGQPFTADMMRSRIRWYGARRRTKQDED